MSRRKPKVGDVVLWYSGSNKSLDPIAAVVTRAESGTSTVNLSLIDENNTSLLIRDGVRHLDDPRSRTEHGRKNGAWDFTPRDRLLDQLLEQLLDAESPEEKVATV